MVSDAEEELFACTLSVSRRDTGHGRRILGILAISLIPNLACAVVQWNHQTKWGWRIWQIYSEWSAVDRAAAVLSMTDLLVYPADIRFGAFILHVLVARAA